MSVICRDGRYIARFKDQDGNQREHSFGYGEEARLAAEDYCRQWKEWHQQVKQVKQQNESIVDESTITLKKLVEEYLEQERVSGRSTNHIYSLKAVAEGIFYPQLGANTPIACRLAWFPVW